MNDRVAALTVLEFGTPVEGGFFAGYINTPEGRFGIAVAPKATGEFKGPLLPKYQDLPGARSYCDCRANTLALAAAGSAIAKRVLHLDDGIGGCGDWALPSRDVLELLYRNLKPTTQANLTSFRDGDNPSSIPVGYPYTEELPTQTAAAAFRKGGPEAFEPTWYWSSTQYSESTAWIQNFSLGYQNASHKDSKVLARAVRRFAA